MGVVVVGHKNKPINQVYEHECRPFKYEYHILVVFKVNEAGKT